MTIVGPGALGTALAKSLPAAGIAIAQMVYRGAGSARRIKALAKEVGATAVTFDTWIAQSRSFGPRGRAGAPVRTLVWLCVGDSDISKTAGAMAEHGSWKGATVFHSSGALSSDELQPLRRAGVRVASVHPMMTFVRSAAPSMEGVPFAMEGDAAGLAMARKVVRTLGGKSFVISKEDKSLYHALGAFVSPLVVAQMAAAERIGRTLGLDPKQTRKIVAPILQQTVRNYIEYGPAAAFSGPIVRGDVETVRRNMTALKRVPGAVEIYRALARVAVEELPSKDAAAIGRTLRRR